MLPLVWLEVLLTKCLELLEVAEFKPVAELLLPRVHTALSRDIGATPGQRLVVSVSGGCDSVALLHLLLALQPRWRLRLHFNHGLP